MTSILFKFSGTADIFTKKFGKMINHNNDKPNGFIVKFLISVSQSMDLSDTLKVHQGWDNFRLLKALYKWWKMLFISRCSLYSLEIYILLWLFGYMRNPNLLFLKNKAFCKKKPSGQHLSFNIFSKLLTCTYRNRFITFQTVDQDIVNYDFR